MCVCGGGFTLHYTIGHKKYIKLHSCLLGKLGF